MAYLAAGCIENAASVALRLIYQTASCSEV